MTHFQGQSLPHFDLSSLPPREAKIPQGLSFKIGWFYPKYLNLYGDRGNVEILAVRAKLRGIPVEIVEIDLHTPFDSATLQDINLIFMGGGPDLDQQQIYKDFLDNKGPYLKEYLSTGGTGLFICGSYQLLGNYYKSADGTTLEGLRFLDFYTEHYGKKKPRSIGNISVELNPLLQSDPVFINNDLSLIHISEPTRPY